MNKILVHGGRRLTGTVRIGGSKNAALPLLFAGILTEDVCIFSDLPRVSDVLQTLEILKCLGARIRFLRGGEVQVDYGPMHAGMVSAELTAAIRGSAYLLGGMLGRFGRAAFAGAGGCDFGARPIDQHLMGFAKLGAGIEERGDALYLDADKGLTGAEISLAMPSVGATANLVLAAVKARGQTVIRNAAAEPHVMALVDFLCGAGAKIRCDKNAVIVDGVPRLHGISCRIIPDMIEAGTYLCMGIACGGRVRVENVCPSHLGALLSGFRQMGVRVEIEDAAIAVCAPHGYRNIFLQTGPFPGFPTDLHPQMAALFACGGKGTGGVRERIFASRFRYTEGLCRMGAAVQVEGDTVLLTPKPLSGCRMASPDLRGGAALLTAALAAEGKSEITNAATIGRGYEHLEEKLRSLGACVRVY